MNGVIQASTGYLIRFGYCEFIAATGETLVSNVPQDSECLSTNNSMVSKWTGASWVQVSIGDTISLDQHKKKRFNDIDTRTGELISAGFTYNGKTFSLSSNAQTNILALFATKGHPALSYPIQYSTIDDADTYNVVNATDVENMYLTALGAKRALLDSGTALKNQVRTCTTKSEVDAIIDNR